MGLKGYFVREKKEAEAAGASAAPAGAQAIEVREKKAEATEEVDILDTILSGKELVTTIDTDYGEFQFKYPSGADQIRMSRRNASYHGGHPDASFDAVSQLHFEQWSTLDVLIVGKPDRFAKIDSWADCPDQKLIDELYERGARFCIDIREKIRLARSGGPLA